MRAVPAWSVSLALSFLARMLVLVVLAGVLPAAVQAQSVPKSLEQGVSDAVQRNRKNEWTVGVAGGQLSGTYMTFANELAEVLDDGDNLRVVPIVTYGAASNLDDLLYLRQVDVAVTQADVFEYFRTQRRIANLDLCGSITSCACPSRSSTFSPEPTSKASRTSAARR